METLTKKPEGHNLIDELEVELLKYPAVELPETHTFTPGMYIREVFIPAGTMVTSMCHKTEHPFVLSQGTARVTSEHEGQCVYSAPHTGVTLPGDRRAVYAITDVTWTTFHVTDKTDVEEVMEDVLEPHDNAILKKLNKKILPGWRKSLPPKKLWQDGQ